MSGLSFTGKVVLVTGASSTVGSELAKYFSKLGASLVLTDSDKYRLNKVGEECSGSSVLKIAADLTKVEDAASVVKQTVAAFKKLDVLINYVGPVDSFTFDGQTPADGFKFMMNVYVCPVYTLTQMAHPHLVKTGGNVVNVLGVLYHLASSALSCKVSSSALDELTRSLAMEYSRSGVRVNAVTAGLVENRPENTKIWDEIPKPKRTHLGPEDIAAAVVFLASDLATFISGANLPVNGAKRIDSGDEIHGSPNEINQEKSVKGAVKSHPPKSEQSHPDPHKKEQSQVEHSKHDLHKEEPAKSSVKPDTRKTETDKSTATVKHQGSEKTSKPATKNN